MTGVHTLTRFECKERLFTHRFHVLFTATLDYKTASVAFIHALTLMSQDWWTHAGMLDVSDVMWFARVLNKGLVVVELFVPVLQKRMASLFR